MRKTIPVVKPLSRLKRVPVEVIAPDWKDYILQ